MKIYIDDANMQRIIDYSDELTPKDRVMALVAQAIQEDTQGKIREALIELGWTPPAQLPNMDVDQ